MASLGSGLLLPGTSPDRALPSAPQKRLRYAIVGTGNRGSGMWGAGVIASELRGRRRVRRVVRPEPEARRSGAAAHRRKVPTFTDFEAMCRDARPELLAVMTVDAHHAEYIVKGLDRGLRVLTEKPMVTDERQCRAVLEARARRNRREISVAFNYRYSPRHERIQQILASGELGRVVAVSFDWYLDTQHSASSGAGIVCERARARCSYTRPPTTSISSTGGSTPIRWRSAPRGGWRPTEETAPSP